MAISNLNLNVRANTSRALADFNKFSRSLDNKFLISGLKLDVIRSALNTINRDFQRAIGEQGLASAGSLRAAQNQAALLTQTFKGFASESALAITTQIGTALNRVAVTAGGTMKDVQRTLAATPFISTNLSEDLRKQLSVGIMSAQRDLRRAGLGDNFGGIAQQFLMGRATGLQLVETGGAIESFLGAEIIKRAGGEGRIYSPEMRSEILAEIVNDPDIQDQLKLMARRAAGFRIVLEDLNTQLFNTESGVFGALRKVIDRSGKSTTMFDEVNELVESIFGKDGMFRSIFKSIKEVFGIGDPMRPLITAVQFIKGMVDEFTKFFSGSVFKDILQFSKEALSRVSDLFKEIYETIRGADFSPDSIRDAIGQIGSSLREYIREFGEYIRGQDISDESGVVGGIAGTLLEEVGKTAVTVIKELLSTILNKVPEIATQVLPELNKGINAVLTEAFGSLAPLVKTMVATMPGPLGMAARSSLITDFTGGQGGLGLLGAAAPFLLAGRGGPVGALKSLGGTGRGATAFRGLGLSLAGLDPAVSLLGAFAPQLFGNIRGAAKELREAPGRIMNASRFGISPGRTLIRGVKGGFGLLGRGMSATGNLLSRGAGYLGAVGSGYLGAVAPLMRGVGSRIASSTQSLGSSISRSTGRLFSPLTGFVRGQRNQFLSGFRPPFPNIAVGAGTTRAYNAGQFFSKIPNMVSNIPYQVGQFVRNTPGNLLASADSFAKGSINFVKTVGNSSKNMVRSVFSAGSSVRGGITSFGTRVLNGSRGAVASIGKAITNIVASIVSLGNQVLASSKAALANIGKAITNIVASIVSLGNQVLASSKAALASMGTALRNMVSGIVALGSKVLASSVTFLGKIATATVNLVTSLVSMGNSASAAAAGAAARINMSARGFGVTALAGGGLAIAGQVVGQKVGGEKGEAIGDTLGIIGSAISTIGAAAGIAALKGTPLGPKGMAIAGLIGAATAAIGLLTTKNIDTGGKINNFSGKNYLGPALALEARMSGRKPMVVNDSEFVIPRDGFPILAGLVGQNLRSTGVINQGESKPVVINISLSVTANSVVANAEELADTLRDPVYQIINDAWTEAYNSNNVLRAKV